MKSKIVGIGQCGSRVVQDFLSEVFPQVPDSKAVRSVANMSQLTKWYKEQMVKFQTATLRVFSNLQVFFSSLKVSDRPRLYVVDGNTDNAVVRGMANVGPELNNLIYCSSIPLQFRHGGCSISIIGQALLNGAYDHSESVGYKNCIGLSDEDLIMICAASSGGTGAGGILSMNRQFFSLNSGKNFALLNVLIIPESDSQDYKHRWNSGRCIRVLKKGNYQPTGTILVSNESETIERQVIINKFVTNLMIRLINSKYAGNTPVIRSELDIADMKTFFASDIVFCGLGTLVEDDARKPNADKLMEQVFTRNKQPTSGLSVPIADRDLSLSSSVLVLLGIPQQTRPDVLVDFEVHCRNILTSKIANLADIQMYSYGSVKDLELTVFFAFNDPLVIRPVQDLVDTYERSFNHGPDKLRREHDIYQRVINGDISDRSVRAIYGTIAKETTAAVPLNDIERIMKQNGV